MVTGANGGLAKELCTQLVRECDLRTLIVHCRRQDAATALCASLQEQREKSCILVPVSGDFSSLKEVSAVADSVMNKVETLDVLVCVAGIATVPQRLLSTDGYELQFAVNHLAHFHLVSKLVPLLECGGGGRVVTVATTQSVIQRAQLDLDDLSSDKSYNMFSAYLGSKLVGVRLCVCMHVCMHMCMHMCMHV